MTIAFPHRTAPLEWRLRRDSIGSATLVSACHNVCGEMRVKELTSHYVFFSLRRGAAEVSTSGGAASLVPGERGIILNPSSKGTGAWPAGTETLNVIVEQGALSAHLSALTGITIHAPPLHAACQPAPRPPAPTSTGSSRSCTR